MTDMVDHPPHYTQTPFGIEVIEITRHYDFDLGNALKYILRAGVKNLDGTTREMMPVDTAAAYVKDLRKAVWYLQDAIAMKRRQFEGVDLDDPWAPALDEGPAFGNWCHQCSAAHSPKLEYDHEPIGDSDSEGEVDDELWKPKPTPVVMIDSTPPAEAFDLSGESEAFRQFFMANPALAELISAMRPHISDDYERKIAEVIESEFRPRES